MKSKDEISAELSQLVLEGKIDGNVAIKKKL
jgi:hypothetical protein